MGNKLRQLPLALHKAIGDSDRFCGWAYRERGEKLTKPPIIPWSTAFASVNNPRHFTTFEDALASWRDGFGAGIGWLVDAGFVVLDLDDAVKDGRIARWAQDLIDDAASYAEFSVSGEGVHVIGKCKGSPLIAGPLKLGGGSYEVYRGDCHRYVTISGREIGRCRQLRDITQLVDTLLPRDAGAHRKKDGLVARKRTGENVLDILRVTQKCRLLLVIRSKANASVPPIAAKRIFE